MKFDISTKAAVDAVKLLSIIPYRKGIQCSEFVQLGFAKSAITLRLAAEIAGFAELKADVQAGKDVFHLDRGPLFPFLQSFESGGPDTLCVDIEGQKVKMKGGSRSATFAVAADVAVAYPDTILRDEKKIEWTPEQAAALNVLQHYVCTDALSPELTAVWVSPKKKGMFASNRLAIAGFWAGEGLPYAGPFPSSLVPHMATAKGIYKGGGDTPGVRLSFGRTHLTQSMKVETANFPVAKVATALGDALKPKIKVEAGALAAVVGRLKACSGDSIDQLDVHLSTKSGKLEIVTKTVSATLRETLDATSSGEHTANMLWGTLHPLITSLKGDAMVNIGWDSGPYHVWAKDSIYILSAKKASK